MRMAKADACTAASRGNGTFENGIDALGRDAGAFVFDSEDRVRSVVANGERYFATARGESDRVQQEVREDLKCRANARDLFMSGASGVDHELDAATSCFGRYAGDGGCRCRARTCLRRIALRDFSADCFARDAVADARVRARNFERVAFGTVRQLQTGYVEPPQHDRKRIRNLMQGAG